MNIYFQLYGHGKLFFIKPTGNWNEITILRIIQNFFFLIFKYKMAKQFKFSIDFPVKFKFMYLGNSSSKAAILCVLFIIHQLKKYWTVIKILKHIDY